MGLVNDVSELETLRIVAPEAEVGSWAIGDLSHQNVSITFHETVSYRSIRELDCNVQGRHGGDSLGSR